MKSYIYRCSNKPDMYIYLAEEDNFDNVPGHIFNRLGIVEFCMELALSKKTKLARENITTVINNLKQHGFHLQLANKLSVDEMMKNIAKSHSENTQKLKEQGK